MKSFDGAGGPHEDIEFCDTSVIDPAAGDGVSRYAWWQGFSEGKRFYVPEVARLNTTETVFNIKELTDIGNDLLKAHPTRYPNSGNFGRKSFEKIVDNLAMSFPKAVLATRTINQYLEKKNIRDTAGNIIQIGKGRILMSGYRVEGFVKTLAYYSEQILAKGQRDEPAEAYIANASGVAQFIVEALKTDDAKFVVYPTALQIVRAVLRERHLFGISGDVTEGTFIKLGPPRGASYSKLDLRLSVPETGDVKEGMEADPKFAGRASNGPHPDNPFKQAV